MQGSSITRRVCVAGVEPEDTSLRIELFRTLIGYGIIESVCFQEDRTFHSGSAVIQYQSLSSAERLKADITATGRQWTLTFLPPVVHVGNQLFLTSPKPIDAAHIRSIATDTLTGMDDKILAVPHALIGDVAAVEGSIDAERGARGVFLRALSCARAHAIGPFSSVLSFSSVPEANRFLSAHQATLARSSGVYATHVGPSGGSLQLALADVLLSRRLIADTAQGSQLRGIVVRGASGIATCDVDAGLFRGGRSLLLRTQTHFAKVAVWDSVDVRLTALPDANADGPAEGELRSVRHSNAGTGTATTATISTTTATATSALMGASSVGVPLDGRPSRGVGRGLPTAAVGPAATSGGNALERLRRMPGAPTPPLSSRAVAGKLFQALQQQRRNVENNEVRERLHAFPAGLRVFAAIAVCVERIGSDGLYARSVARAESPRTWPVFIPSHFVPCDGAADWRDFAVAGERMAVVLLYAAAVGGSEATLRLIASKREAEMRRAYSEASTASSTASSTAAPLSVGDVFTGSRAVLLQAAPGVEGAVHIVEPAMGSPAGLFAVPLIIAAANTEASGPQQFAVAKIARGAGEGEFATIVAEEEYKRMEAERIRELNRHDEEKYELVRSVLEGALGHTEERKRARTE